MHLRWHTEVNTFINGGKKNNPPKKKERMFIGGAGKSIGRTERIF